MLRNHQLLSFYSEGMFGYVLGVRRFVHLLVQRGYEHAEVMLAKQDASSSARIRNPGNFVVEAARSGRET